MKCNRKPIFLISMILCLCLPLLASADTKKIWHGEPITMHLPVDHEVRVIFPTAVDVQVPMGIASRLQSLAPNSSMLYWTAVSPFDKARVFAMSLDGQSVYILDIVASEAGLKDDVVIEDPARILDGQESVAQNEETPLRDPAPIVLTRYVSQSLYAPKRLLPTTTDINLVDTPHIPNDFPLLRSSRGESYRVEAIGQWNGFDQYITAVLVTNVTDIAVPVELSNLRGRFTHATAQHTYLGATGTLDDRTTLYLVSDVPFQDAIMEDGYAY